MTYRDLITMLSLLTEAELDSPVIYQTAWSIKPLTFKHGLSPHFEEEIKSKAAK